MIGHESFKAFLVSWDGAMSSLRALSYRASPRMPSLRCHQDHELSKAVEEGPFHLS